MFSKRLLQFIENQQYSIRAFEIECEITNGVISKALKNETILNGKNLIRISNRFPELSIDWLLTGKGEMIVTNDKEDSDSDEKRKDEELQRLRTELQEWKDIVEVLKLAVRSNPNKPK